MVQQTYTLSGLHCEACVKRVQTLFSELEHVQSVVVTLEPQQAVITSESALTAETLKMALARAGNYRLEEMVSLLTA